MTPAQARSLFQRAITEASFQRTVIEMAIRLGWRVAHFRPARTLAGRWATPMQGHKGFPDLVLARSPRVIFAELKTMRGQPSEDQLLWAAALRPTGHSRTSHEYHLWRPGNMTEIEETLK